jgi:TRAP-type C4-dicarboxylate transport system permease small subunit
MTGSVLGIVAWLRRLNRAIALLGGGVLLATGAFILVEIVLRQTALGALGGSDEIAGYVMAAFATWGFSYALLERTHVRIDLLQRRLPPTGRALFDLLALGALAATASVVAFHAWSVLATTLDRGSRANTPLETPLWIPQSIWFAGWVWFAAVSLVLLICLIVLMLARRFDEIETIAGNRAETEPAE